MDLSYTAIMDLIFSVFSFVANWLKAIETWAQFGMILGALVVAFWIARKLNRILHRMLSFEHSKISQLRALGAFLTSLTPLIFPLLAFGLASAAELIAQGVLGTSIVAGLGKRLIMVYAVSVCVKQVLNDPLLRALGRFIAMPTALIYALGLLPQVVGLLSTTQIPLGNLSFYLIDVFKLVAYGGVLVWLSGWTNLKSSTFINDQPEMRPAKRQLAVKAVEIFIYGLAFLILMNLLEADLNKFVVLSGAIGVGLGFGLQKIASNFISGVILLLEGQATVGDYVELDGGEAGTIVKMLSRAVILETYDGRWIVVPNEDFIITRVVNYSDSGSANRYEAAFSVSYDTDINLIPPMIEAAVAQHPEVLDEPFPPDCELRALGDNGIEFAVEFWVNGIDDGKNKFVSDVLFIVWNTLKSHKVEVPYPQQVIHFKKSSES